jgi:hypothetical protein
MHNTLACSASCHTLPTVPRQSLTDHQEDKWQGSIDHNRYTPAQQAVVGRRANAAQGLTQRMLSQLSRLNCCSAYSQLASLRAATCCLWSSSASWDIAAAFSLTPLPSASAPRSSTAC